MFLQTFSFNSVILYFKNRFTDRKDLQFNAGSELPIERFFSRQNTLDSLQLIKITTSKKSPQNKEVA